MVKFHQVNDWMKLVGNLGVFLGLLLVALQMYQANNIARAEQQAEGSKAYQDMEIGVMGEQAPAAWVKSIFDPATLTREEMRVLDAYLIIELNVMKRVGYREDAGLEPAGAFKAKVTGDAAYFFGNTFAQTWWKYEKVHHTENDKLVEYLDEAIATLEPNHTANWMLRIERDIRQQPPVTIEDLN